jgi:hypothetical protein
MYNIDLGLEAFSAALRIKKAENEETRVFDPIRKKWILLEPEEFVRQLLIQKMMTIPGFSLARMAVEKVFKYLPKKKRFDLLIYDRNHQPYLLVECKAPSVEITEKTFLQAGWYNEDLKVPYVLVTNGPHTFCLSIDHQTKQYAFLKEIPVPSIK